MVSRSCLSHTPRTPAGEMVWPCFLSSLETRTWPNAGLSIAISTTAVSIAGSTRFFSIGFLLLISASASSPPFSYSSLKR